MSPKQFVNRFLVISIVVFASISAFNFIVNPYAQYPSRFVEPLVQTSRATKVEYLSGYAEAPQGLLLGSSRVLKYEPQYLAKKFQVRSFFNAGVNYAKPEDHLAMLRFYRDRFGKMPGTVVIGLDVHGFNDSLTTDARLLNNRNLVQQISDVVPFKDRFQGVKELVSWKQTTSSLSAIRKSIRAKEESPHEWFQPDGLIVYDKREREIAEGSYDFESAIDYSKREYKQLYSGYQKLSRRRIACFQKTVETCREAGTRVVVLLTPMHPELVDYLAESTTYFDRRAELVELLQDQSGQGEFAFLDLSDLDKFGGSPERFVDGIHPLESNTRLIIDQLATLKNDRQEYAVQ